MTHKEKAEKYVRSQIKELMELSFGCEVETKKGRARVFTAPYLPDVQFYSDSEIANPTGFLAVDFVKIGETEFTFYAENKLEEYKTKDIIENIGHPIQLQHWLRALKEVDTELYLIESGLLEVAVGELFDTTKIYFNLTTGQPATEDDYQKICEILGISK